MRSVFTDKFGKYSTAVYLCELITDNPDQYTEAWIERLFPLAHGHSVSATHPTRHFKMIRWYMLIANSQQTTRADVVNRIINKGHGVTRDQVTVSVMMAVPERGRARRVGTPRVGTKRELPNAPHHTGLAAR